MSEITGFDVAAVQRRRERERENALAPELFETFRWSGAKYWNELTERERSGWERVASSVLESRRPIDRLHQFIEKTPDAHVTVARAGEVFVAALTWAYVDESAGASAYGAGATVDLAIEALIADGRGLL